MFELWIPRKARHPIREVAVLYYDKEAGYKRFSSGQVVNTVWFRKHMYHLCTTPDDYSPKHFLDMTTLRPISAEKIEGHDNVSPFLFYVKHRINSKVEVTHYITQCGVLFGDQKRSYITFKGKYLKGGIL